MAENICVRQIARNNLNKLHSCSLTKNKQCINSGTKRAYGRLISVKLKLLK